MSRYVAVSVRGDVKIHLPAADYDYATLCGLDGADENPMCDHSTVEVPPSAKIDCDSCIAIWLVARSFKKNDFQFIT